MSKLINFSYLNDGESSVFRISLHLYILQTQNGPFLKSWIFRTILIFIRSRITFICSKTTTSLWRRKTRETNTNHVIMFPAPVIYCCSPGCSSSWFFLPHIFKRHAWVSFVFFLFFFCTKAFSRSSRLVHSSRPAPSRRSPKMVTDFSARLQITRAGVELNFLLVFIPCQLYDYPFEFVSASHRS